LRFGLSLTGEQLNTALWALMNQQKIWREEDGLLKRGDGDSGRISLNAIYMRRKGDYRRLEDVISYCEDTVCLRSRILRYFGETSEQDHPCGNCSACRKRKRRPASDQNKRLELSHKGQDAVGKSADNSLH
jgi:superfamily II DNA helicase RecQ